MSKLILAVDDVGSVRVVIKKTLTDAGHKVIEAADGESALAYARTHPVDMVIADLYMPGIDGIALIAQLRSLPAYHLTPMVLLTTEASPERKAQAKQAGASGWIVKPFKPSQLLAALERFSVVKHPST